jgi:hypothetical protein
MKRKAGNDKEASVKRTKVEDYCNVDPRRDDRGRVMWPAPNEQIIAAQVFIKEW